MSAQKFPLLLQSVKEHFNNATNTQEGKDRQKLERLKQLDFDMVFEKVLA